MFRKMYNNTNLVNPRGGYYMNQSYNVTSDYKQTKTDTWHGRAYYIDTYMIPLSKLWCHQYLTAGGGDFGRYSGYSRKFSSDWHTEAGPGSSNYSHHQCNQLIHNMVNPHHYNQFQRLMYIDNIGGSSSPISSIWFSKHVR